MPPKLKEAGEEGQPSKGFQSELKGAPDFTRQDLSAYREYRKRVKIFHLRGSLAGWGDIEIGLQLISGLTGRAWVATEVLDIVNYDASNEKSLVQDLLALPGSAFRYDPDRTAQGV